MSALFLYREQAGGYAPEISTFIARDDRIWASLLFLLLLVNSFYITRVVSRNMIYVERTYMSSLIYLIVSAGYTLSGESVKPLMAALLIIFAGEQMISSYGREGRNSCFFNASLALGTAAMIYTPAAAMLLWLVAGLILLGRPGREWAMSAALFAFPFFVLSYVSWAAGGEFLSVWENMLSGIMESGGAEPLDVWEYLLAGIVAAVTVVSLVSLRVRGKGMRKRSYAAYRLFAWLLLFSLAIFALPCRSPQMLPLPAVALAVVMPAWFDRNRTLVPAIAYFVMIAAVIIYNVTRL